MSPKDARDLVIGVPSQLYGVGQGRLPAAWAARLKG